MTRFLLIAACLLSGLLAHAGKAYYYYSEAGNLRFVVMEVKKEDGTMGPGNIKGLANTELLDTEEAAEAELPSIERNDAAIVLLGDIRIFPNPAITVLSIDMGAVESANMVVVGATGLIAASGGLCQGINQLPVAGLAAGPYTVIITAAGLRREWKITKY